MKLLRALFAVLCVAFSLRFANARSQFGIAPVASTTSASSPPLDEDEFPSPPPESTNTAEPGSIATHSVQERPPLVLILGEQRLLQAPDLERYALGSPCVRVHRLQKQALLIKGIVVGDSDIWVWKKDGESEHRLIRVEKNSGSELAAGLEKALGRLETTEVLLMGSNVVLQGPMRDAKESARIGALLEAFPKFVRDQTVPDEAFVKDGEKRLNSWMQSTPMARGLKLEREGRTLFVRGSLERPALQSLAEKELRRIYPQASLELDSLPDTSPTVYFRVFLLELKKSKFHTLGLSWPALQESAFRVTTSAVEDALSLDVALNTLEGEGALKILSNPELVVRAPGEAELFAGGELPIQAKSHFFSSVSWKS